MQSPGYVQKEAGGLMGPGVASTEGTQACVLFTTTMVLEVQFFGDKMPVNWSHMTS